MNIPVVASDLSGMVEFKKEAEIKGYKDIMYLVHQEDVEDLAKTITEVLKNKSERNTREYIEKYFSPETHCKIIRETFDKLKNKENL